MSTRLRVSDKVVLSVPRLPPRGMGIRPTLRLDRIYCVREAGTTTDGTPAVLLVGVRCPPGPDGGEMAIHADQFRRVGRSSQRQPREEA